MLRFLLTCSAARPLAAQDVFLKAQTVSPPEQSSGWDYLLPRCTDGEQYGWPVFQKQADLQASPWGKYFELVYGEVPDRGYPICTYGQMMLYRPHFDSAGVTPPNNFSSSCVNQVGQWTGKMTGLTDADWVNWIWNPGLAFAQGLPSNMWVEVFHIEFNPDGSATWMYYTPGSAIWTWLGSTNTYDDHTDAFLDLTDEECDESVFNCNSKLEYLYTGMRNKGVDTVQFLKHHDRVACHGLIEIVDLGGSGAYVCGQDSSGPTRFKAGWGAAHECNCRNSNRILNCDGFGIRNH